MHVSKILLAVSALLGTTLALPVEETGLVTRQTAKKLRISRAGLADLALYQPSLLTYNIVPLGDSITEITCWRALVWDMLADAKLADQVQYVGSQNSNPQNCKPKTANWDEHHEGHSGWLAIDIAVCFLKGAFGALGL
jgi:hypothetical protein